MSVLISTVLPAPEECQAKRRCSRLVFAEGTSACSALASRPQLEVTKASPCSRARNLSRLRVTASPVLARPAARMEIQVLGHVSAVCGGGEEQKSTHCRAASAKSRLLFLVHTEGPLPIWRPGTARCPVPTDMVSSGTLGLARPRGTQPGWEMLGSPLRTWESAAGTAPPSPARICGC